MAIDNSKILVNLPQLPSNNLTEQMFNEFLIVYKAIKSLLAGISQFTGVDAPTPDEWPTSTPGVTILTGNATRMYPIADVAIPIGSIVNLYNSAGSLRARLASASSATTAAHGIANSVGVPGQQFEMNWLRCYSINIGGLVTGTLYWLSTTPGQVQNLPPVAVGTIQQPIGLAISGGELLIDIPLTYKQN